MSFETLSGKVHYLARTLGKVVVRVFLEVRGRLCGVEFVRIPNASHSWGVLLLDYWLNWKITLEAIVFLIPSGILMSWAHLLNHFNIRLIQLILLHLDSPIRLYINALKNLR